MNNKRASIVWPLVVCAGQVFSGIRAKRNYFSLEEISPVLEIQKAQHEELPGISIIVPARNEVTHLPRLLESLLCQEYPLYEIIVVDDASTDGTATLVQSYSKRGVRLIGTDGPPQGWTGKNHACWIGANQAIYPWLLFVDADTRLAPLALLSTMDFVCRQNVFALSLFPRQCCETFWERLLLPFAYQQYFVGSHARATGRKNASALANGQFFLVNRNAYQQVGGHAANAGSIVDDVALATSLKQSGIIPLACRGEELVSVRMYTSLRQIVNGFGKNSYPYLQQSPYSGVQTAGSTALAASVAALFVDAYREKSRRVFLIAALTYVVQVVNTLSWLKHFRINSMYALLAPFSACVFLLIALNSLLHTITGRSVAWKGRRYESTNGVSSLSRVAHRILPQRKSYQNSQKSLSPLCPSKNVHLPTRATSHPRAMATTPLVRNHLEK